MRVFERGWLSSNGVLFIGPDDTALVDTGYLAHAAQTVAMVRHALQGRSLDLVVNTHLHSDHCGGNAALHEVFGCRIAIPLADADKVAAWDDLERVCEGVHERFVIDPQRFNDKLARKADRAGSIA